jgi:hypothetical protein
MSDVVGRPPEDGLVWHYTKGTRLLSTVRSLAALLASEGYDVDVRRSGIPFRG